MKKYLIILFATLSFTFSSCEKDEAGGTAVEKMAGDWYVTWEAKNANGDWEDIGAGTVPLLTYNTTANLSTEMWLNERFILDAPLKVSTDYAAKVFNTIEDITLTSKPFNAKITFSITDGKILEKAAKSPSGVVTDSIVFFVNIEDDETYKVAGFRRTGFLEDEL